MPTEVVRVTKKELKTYIADRETEGFDVDATGTDEFTLKKRNLGRLKWHIIFLVLTAGVGNVIYLVLKLLRDPYKLVVRVK